MARELFSLFLVFWGMLLTVSLVTFNQQDPGLNHVVSSPDDINNAAGLFGAYLSGILVDFFGTASYLWAVGFLLGGARSFIRELEVMWWRWLGIVLLGLSVASISSATELRIMDIAGGGFLGDILYTFGWFYLHPVGAALLWTFITLTGIQLTMGGTWAGLVKRLHGRIMDMLLKYKERKARSGNTARNGKKETTSSQNVTIVEREPETEKEKSKRSKRSLLFSLGGRKKKRAAESAASDAAHQSASGQRADTGVTTDAPSAGGDFIIDDRAGLEEGGDLLEPYGQSGTKAPAKKAMPKVKAGVVKLPTLDLLTDHASQISATSKAELEMKGEMLMDCLADFGVQGELQRITPGPVVTMFEVKPAPGVKVSKIANLADDLAMTLRAISVRIQAPIPGKDSVGIEIPNEDREMVCLRELLGAKTFKEVSSPLTLALGKDIAGKATVADLAKMPHLLVAGATGQGKSVFINSVLMSLVYRAKPEELKLLLIDPKRIELAVYADLPHLVHPVVTDMSQAKSALDWAVAEMDKRYQAMAKMGVRNIIGYNEKLKSFGNDIPEELADLEAIPYLVIIIDELADLMMTASKEVETSIVRLAQLARAAGIHLILATQRPSVDVVTGLIKANFPCRISFQVTAKHDSRTILDTVGAEMLLGKGDMLFKPGGGKLQRLHGAFVEDDDVAAVVSYWKSMLPPSYKVDFNEWGSEGTGDLSGAGANGYGDGIPDDPLYQEAVQFVMEQGKASISLIQRRFRIGFNKAARYVEQMEQDGIVGPADGSKPRTVITGRDDY